MGIRRAIAVAFALQALLLLPNPGCRKGESDAAPAESVSPTVSAEEVLEKMLAAYEAANSYFDNAQYIRQTIRRDEGIQRDTVIFNLSLALERPNKMRFKSLRAYPTSSRNETYDVASDGVLVRTLAGELSDQVHETLAPAQLTPENFVLEPNVREAAVQVSLENLYPQIRMMFESESDETVFPSDQSPRVLGHGELRDRKCHLIALDNPAGKRILWIDAESYLLLRMELPIEAQLPLFDPYGEFSRYAVLIDYLDPQLGQPLNPEQFALAVPDGARRVRRLVPPPPPAPPAELGKPVAEFAFTTLAGEPVTPASLTGKVALLEFWSQNCPPCREHTPLLEKVYQELKSDEDFAFYAVNMDPVSFTNVAATRTYNNWGGTIPILRDPEDTGYEKLGVRYFPHTILVGADGRLQYTFSGMHVRPEPLLETVRKLLAGEDLAAEAHARHARLIERSKADLKAAELTGSLVDRNNILPQIASRKLPQQFEMVQHWQSAADTLKKPGDIQLSASGLLVLDAGKTIIELDATGKQSGRHDLPANQELANGFIRVAATDTGRQWCTVSGVGWQKVHVFDDQWQNVITFPEDEHSRVGDILFADLAGAGAPLLYVGYLGGQGIQGVTLDGRKVWVNHRLDHVLQIAAGATGEDGKRQAWITSSRGTITRLAVDGQFVGEFSVAGQTIAQVGPVPALDSGLTGYCGLASSGNGEHVAVGFDAEGEVTWRHELPRGDYSHRIPAIQITKLPSHETCWIVAAADGSLHWLDNQGELIDRCDYGAALTGIAADNRGDTPALYLATENELTAWQLKEKPIESATEPVTETPAEE